MRTDKEKAFELRKTGKSYSEIIDLLGMSKSTLSNWFQGVDFSEEIKKNLTAKIITENTIRIHSLNKARGDTLKALYERARQEALLELEKHKDNPLFISAIVAYWGEGDKAHQSFVRLANTDPKMIKLFVLFLTTVCNISKDKLCLALHTYPDLDDQTCRHYWSTQTGITRFHKTMVLPSKHKTKKLPYGTCTILIVNTYLKKKMLLWIDHLPEIVLNRATLLE